MSTHNDGVGENNENCLIIVPCQIFLQELKYSLEKKTNIIEASIKEALESVDNNRADKKEESVQQLQKLKSSTTDLKVRFDTVSCCFSVAKWNLKPGPSCSKHR